MIEFISGFIVGASAGMILVAYWAYPKLEDARLLLKTVQLELNRKDDHAR